MKTEEETQSPPLIWQTVAKAPLLWIDLLGFESPLPEPR